MDARRRHSHSQPQRPRDAHGPFWEMLLLLAREPALGWLQEALSRGSASPRQGPAADASFAPAARPRASLLQEDPAIVEMRGAVAAPRGGSRSDGAASHGTEGNRASNGEPFPGSQAHLAFSALRLVEHSGHPRIWKAYCMGLRLFITFRETTRSPSAWPIPGNQIRGFMLSLDSQGLTSPKILMYIAGLSYISRMFNFRDPFQDFFNVRMVMALQYQRGPPRPLSLEVLQSLLGTMERVCSSFYERLLFQAVYLLSFFAALRPEEIVAGDSVTPHPKLLLLSDFDIQQDSFSISIRASEIGPARSVFHYMRSREQWLCPVLALNNYLAARPRGEGPLFIYGNGQLLTRDRFLDVFYSALRRLDLPLQQYDIQSFWLGSLTTAVRYRCSQAAILRLARWPM